MARDFTHGNPMRNILMFAVPMLIGNIFQQLYSTVDSIIVGNFEGSNALAAISSSVSIQFLLVAVAMGFTGGISVVISQVFGARDHDKLKRVFSTGLIFMMGLAVVLGLCGVMISNPLLRMLGTPEEIMVNSSKYLKIMFLGMPAMFLYNMYASVMRAIGDSKTPLWFLIIATIVNIGLDYFFVANLGMGVAGVAWATLIAQGLSGLLCHFYVHAKVPLLSIGKGEWIFDKDIIGAIINYGFPAAIQQSIVSISMLFIQSFINFFGRNMMAAFGVANRIENFALMPVMNIAMALSMFAGQNIGAGKEKRALEGVKSTVIVQIGFCVVMAVIIPFVAPSLTSLFGLKDDPDVIRLCLLGLDFSSKFYFIFATFQTLNQFHRGVGDTKFSMVASLCMVFVRIPFTYVLVHIIHMGEISIWMGMVIGWVTALIVNSIRFFTGGWRGKAYVQKIQAD